MLLLALMLESARDKDWTSVFPPSQLSLLAILECSEKPQAMLEEKVYNNLYFLCYGAKKILNVGFIVFSTLKGFEVCRALAEIRKEQFRGGDCCLKCSFVSFFFPVIVYETLKPS